MAQFIAFVHCWVTKLCPTLCNPMDYSSPGLPALPYLTELGQTHVHRVGDAIQPSHPLSFPSPPALSSSQHQGLSNDSALCIRYSQYWHFSFSPCNEYSRLIFCGIDWFDLLAVHGTPESLLQHHSLKASVFQHSAFFMVQLSHPYMTTGKTIALTIQTFVSKVSAF